MKIEWDFSELEEFGKRVSSEYEVDTALMTATQNVARVLHQHLLNLTPVLTGNLRKMWSAGDNLLFTVNDVGDGFEVTFINEAKNPYGSMYGVPVNDGYTLQNGTFKRGRMFVQKSISLTKEELETLVMKELQKWWSGV